MVGPVETKYTIHCVPIGATKCHNATVLGSVAGSWRLLTFHITSCIVISKVVVKVVVMKRPKRLSAAFVKTVTHSGRYGDGHGGLGLSLMVKPRANGGLSKTWAQRQRIDGRLVSLGLGSYPVITLARARSKALVNARAVAEGSDPRAKPSTVPTFAEAVKVVIDIHRVSWKDAGRSAKIWHSSLNMYALPRIGSKRVSEVTSADVLDVLMEIWNEKPETARRVKHRISAVMKWAVAQGFRDDNPAGETINEALPRMNGVKRHRRALHHSKVKDAIERVKNSEAWESTKLCFEFLTLTAARSGEVRAAQWDEIDLDRSVWIVPAERMKTSREHRVPLSCRSVEVLREAADFFGGTGLVFPSITGKILSDSTVSKLLRELDIEAVPHGFRSSFRDWCAESGQPREIAEAALAHTVQGVEGAYFRSDLFELRRHVMDAWAEHIS